MNSDPGVLLTALGSELLGLIAKEFPDAVPGLAEATRLRRDYPADLVAAAMAQHELRLAARAKFSRAGEMLFTRAGYEQSSSETIARHRAARLADAGCVADLCCGIGGDLAVLAATGHEGRRVLAVDLNPVHARLARHNASVYQAGAHEEVVAVVADVRDIRLAGIDAVFTDPARRDAGGRFRAGVYEPPLDWCLELAAKVPAVCVKAAPGLDTSVVPSAWEAEFIADGRDLKEAVLWSPALASGPRRATILPGGHTLAGCAGPPVDVREPGAYLLDPSPAVTRAGLVEDLARDLSAGKDGAGEDSVWKIDPQIAFLSSASAVATPFARTLMVIDSAPWTEKRFAARLRELGVGAADLRRRGLAGDVDQIRRRLRLQGPHRATLVLTRVRDKPWGLICADPGSPLAAAQPPGWLAGRLPQQDAAHVQGLAHVHHVVVDHAHQAHAQGDRRCPVGVHDPVQVRVGQVRYQPDGLRVHGLAVGNQQFARRRHAADGRRDGRDLGRRVPVAVLERLRRQSQPPCPIS
jgi:SAM-dependent methyltransferase